MRNKFFVILVSVLIVIPAVLLSQTREIPLSEELRSNVKQYRIKLGAVTMNKTIPIKIGPYSMQKVRIKKNFDEDAKFMGIPVENQYTATFSADLKDKQGRTASIEAAQNIDLKEQFALELNRFIEIGKYSLISDTNVSSVLINTSEQKEDTWLLLMSKTPGTALFSIQNMRLTNGSQEISFKLKASEPYGSILKAASKAIEFYLNGTAIAALQYKTGGGFGYQQFAWISNKASNHLELILTAGIASILQLTDGAVGYDFTE